MLKSAILQGTRFTVIQIAEDRCVLRKPGCRPTKENPDSEFSISDLVQVYPALRRLWGHSIPFIENILSFLRRCVTLSMSLYWWCCNHHNILLQYLHISIINCTYTSAMELAMAHCSWCPCHGIWGQSLHGPFTPIGPLRPHLSRNTIGIQARTFISIDRVTRVA